MLEFMNDSDIAEQVSRLSILSLWSRYAERRCRMTLDDAINRMKSSVEDGMSGIREPKSYIIHTEEYAQMVEFLEELKAWRELKLVCAFDGYVVYKCRDTKGGAV